nr:unnamed protein product [Digitaria exilis]
MAAEAQSESPGPVPPPPPACGGSSPASSPPEKRALTDTVPAVDGEDEGEEEQRLPEPKRRRACVAALDSVPSAEAEGAVGPGSGAAAPFSFQHARGGFLAPETTPKFGSFNPPGEDAAEPAVLDLKPAQRGTGAGGEGSVEADDEVPSASAGGAEDNDESAQVVGGEVDGQVQTDQT